MRDAAMLVQVDPPFYRQLLNTRKHEQRKAP